TVANRQRLILDHDLRDRHLTFWNPETIQKFWSGVSFREPGESNQLSYSLAEIFVNLIGKVKSWRYCHVRPFGPVSLRYSSSTKLVEGTSQEMLSPFSVRLSGANSLELQFTSIRFGVNGRTEKANLCRLEKLGKLLQG